MNVREIEPTTSEYRIQIVAKDNMRVLAWAPGLEMERDLVEEICRRVEAKGVGAFRSSAHVIEDVRSAIQELLLDLKRQV